MRKAVLIAPIVLIAAWAIAAPTFERSIRPRFERAASGPARLTAATFERSVRPRFERAASGPARLTAATFERSVRPRFERAASGPARLAAATFERSVRPRFERAASGPARLTAATFERSVRPRFERAASGPARLTAATNWPAWFAKNTTVTDKKTYVHIFWNANDVRPRFAGSDREPLLAEAARQLVVRQFPAKSAADTAKIDIVFVRERDGYGMPKWDTLERVAHIECSRKKVVALAPTATSSELRKAFDRFELF